MSDVPTKLEPVDATQCQAEVKRGSFMSFGPVAYQRCPRVPVWIAIDVRDGLFYGAMALCDECKRVCEIQLPSASFQELRLQP